MPSNQTANYQLSQWVKSDQIKMEDFNADNAKIDGVLGAHTASLAALEAAAPHFGNCQIYTTTYVGDGQSGQSHPNSLTFPEKPEVIFIVDASVGCLLYMVYGCPSARLDTGGTATGFNTVTWSGKTVSWYGKMEMTQMNQKNITYYVTMLSRRD